MDFTAALHRNRTALLRMVAVLFAMAGLRVGGSVGTVPRHVRLAILHVLRPSESATRRLIEMMRRLKARGGAVASVPAKRAAPQAPIPRGQGARVPSFQLFDARKCFEPPKTRRVRGTGPRISVPGLSDPVFAPVAPPKPDPTPDDLVDAQRLCRRLLALRHALDDLPRQVRRLTRRTARAAAANRFALSPLRPGQPPGHRRRAAHEVDEVLSDCHTLAWLALEHPDTS